MRYDTSRDTTTGSPPGPRGREALGFFGGGSPAGTLAFLERTARRYGPLSSFRILNQRIYLVDDPELTKEILITRQHSFVRDTGATLLRELVGDGLLTSEEPRHRERRRIVQPAFHRDRIASYAAIMTAETERLAGEWRAGDELDIGREMKRLTLSIVGASLFGADFRDSADRIAAVLRRVIRRSARIAPLLAWLEPLLIGYRRLRPGARSVFFASERRELERVIEPIIERRRTVQTGDILSLLLETLPDEDVRNEVVTFVLAGHETTANALTWTWYLLATHPGVETRLRSELAVALDGRGPTLEDLPRLKYADMVFTEAMRLYPPALAFGRRPTETVTLSGYTIPRGSSILLSPYVTHRNERYFPRPTLFEPERWENPSHPKLAYFPFGAGAKMCIGDPFARMEGVLALATIAQKWRFELLTREDVGLAPGITLSPDRPIKLRIVRNFMGLSGVSH